MPCQCAQWPLVGTGCDVCNPVQPRQPETLPEILVEAVRSARFAFSQMTYMADHPNVHRCVIREYSRTYETMMRDTLEMASGTIPATPGTTDEKGEV